MCQQEQLDCYATETRSQSAERRDTLLLLSVLTAFTNRKEHLPSRLVASAGNANSEETVMRNSFLISAAAIAVVASSGFANAQASREQGGASAQQNSTATPSNREGKEPSSGMKSTHSEEKSGMKSTQSEEKSGAQSTQKEENFGVKATQSGENSGAKSTQKEEKSGIKPTQSEEKSGAAKSKGAEENNRGEKSKSMSDSERGKDMKAEGREDRNGTKAEGREDRNGNMNAESKGAAENRSQTTGQAGAGAKLSGEQRTRITTVIRDQHVAPITDVNFSISVGTRVPRDVSFHPLPAEIVTIYPDWRGYEFILVRDQIIVVDPRSFEIVAVLDA
jgi:Protein of unknown function (DUF1236)